jgi:hypothetical protein
MSLDNPLHLLCAAYGVHLDHQYNVVVEYSRPLAELSGAHSARAPRLDSRRPVRFFRPDDQLGTLTTASLHPPVRRVLALRDARRACIDALRKGLTTRLRSPTSNHRADCAMPTASRSTFSSSVHAGRSRPSTASSWRASLATLTRSTPTDINPLNGHGHDEMAFVRAVHERPPFICDVGRFSSLMPIVKPA